MRIALIHALKHSVAPIEAAFARLWPEADLMNLLDDSLSRDVAHDGHLTSAMTERFRNLTRYAVGTGAQGILFTCSAFGPCIEACQAEFPQVPILKPNEAMIEDALRVSSEMAGDKAGGGKIGLLATFGPTLDSMPPEFAGIAPRLQLAARLIEGGMAALDAGDPDTHDRLATHTARELPEDCDVIALAQFSLARAESAIAKATGKKVLTTPGSAVLKLRRALVD